MTKRSNWSIPYLIFLVVFVVLPLILVVLYILGLVAMLTSRVQLALILWVVSTLGGIGLLYWMRTVTRRKEEAEKRESDAGEA